jgi:hypothetical protein
MCPDVAEPGRAAERREPECLREYREQRRCGMRSAIGPGGGGERVRPARQVGGYALRTALARLKDASRSRPSQAATA